MRWDEEVLYEYHLHTKRQDEYGKATSGRHNKKWSLRDTAKELKMSFGVLSENIRIAEEIIKDPVLKDIETWSEARRIILGKIKREKQEKSALEPLDTDNYNCIIYGNPLSVLDTYSDNTFDACITDCSHIQSVHVDIFEKIYKVLKDDSFLYVFLRANCWAHNSKILSEMFKLQDRPLIWFKENYKEQKMLAWQYQEDYQMILCAVKGAPSLTEIGIDSGSIISTTSLKIVITRLIYNSTYENATILDPFANNGIVLEAARNLGRRYVGIESDRYCFEGIKERLKSCKNKED